MFKVNDLCRLKAHPLQVETEFEEGDLVRIMGIRLLHTPHRSYVIYAYVHLKTGIVAESNESMLEPATAKEKEKENV